MEPDFRIPLGDWVAVGLDWLITTLDGFFTAVRHVFVNAYDGLDWLLNAPPFWAVILVFAAIAWWASSWKLGIGTVVGFTVIAAVDQWDNAMHSMALVVIATVVAVVISIPLGIWAASSNRASGVIKPILDFMQTMPAMVYLIPALLMFRVGVVPGIIATIIFAMAPGVRFTELGIRGVDKEVVEAGHAFGSSPARILRQIQLPLARPTIMAGVNQVIMLSLSMVVIAGMVGAPGLGGEIVASLSRIDAGLGFEAGISVVILAIFLDRVTASLGSDKTAAVLQAA
ncbi:glycine/betaine ABC transporter [Arthrobacter livingstonensis]|uniref:Glycine/betaine ABC transporter n=1 Tax=Arthrobacter livingstonensis TaxID=670078 RepID=A0A2V5L2C7_9MICC|nr:proline/glycine betaine ABC transporter permease [Arthrobacter livingstonensis]PYI65399.1 glycine/betaine ABC transporter [Arthrobacter livingstonensis]